MSVQAMTWAWSLEISAGEKLVLLALADRANDDGECWPGVASLAKKCSMGDRTVQMHIKALAEKGLIRSESRRDGQRNKTNLYRIFIGNLPKKGGADSALSDSHPAEFCISHPAESAPKTSELQTSVERHKGDLDEKRTAKPEPAAAAAAKSSVEPAGPTVSLKTVSDQVVEVYHDVCCRADDPNPLPRIKLLTADRRQTIRQRWMQVSKELERYTASDIPAGLEWWRRFFMKVMRSDFLVREWGKVSLDWMLKQKNFIKIVEGNYDNKETRP